MSLPDALIGVLLKITAVNPTGAGTVEMRVVQGGEVKKDGNNKYISGGTALEPKQDGADVATNDGAVLIEIPANEEARVGITIY